MFSFLKSERAKLRETAKNWLYLAGKVYHYRKDRLSESEVSKLVQLSEEVRSQLKAKDENRLRNAIEGLKEHLDHVGGNYYPRGSMAENVEFFFAAVIIYVGVTTFFVKPFKIPTNSMWPTYHGMTGEVYTDDAQAPGLVERAFRTVAFGASHYEVEAPASGEVLVPMLHRGNDFDVLYEPATVKRYFVLNAPGKEYSLYVGDEKTSFKFPADFNFDKEVREPLRQTGSPSPFDLIPRTIDFDDIAGTFQKQIWNAKSQEGVEVTVYLVKTGLKVEKGDTLMNFDLMTGDQLFVDRMSYHFVSPKVGDGFVFKTGEIARITDDVFYIKRLAGTPGDKVRIEDGGLIVNGEPATGSKAFDWNASEEGLYAGYTATPPGGTVIDLTRTVTIPEGSYLALGDNSYNSFDGRGWGYVPEDSVVGRPIMIYYPFTRRFGLAE
ncbi:signal peptidase I [Pelagicoccus sp. SDUM812003]|uniref:signal peptidase I n=1 Tax=Pelagicoccus sp. SDUM812003 TaxID=3041267 RepID=UPI00280C57F5|nr:signal peptidase I [Pelagicoccus sp. SDUM812003]MDQ8204950.1 signal peptidase I [Pelagicoccus sp. SDUM812003]